MRVSFNLSYTLSDTSERERRAFNSTVTPDPSTVSQQTLGEVHDFTMASPGLSTASQQILEVSSMASAKRTAQFSYGLGRSRLSGLSFGSPKERSSCGSSKLTSLGAVATSLGAIGTKPSTATGILAKSFSRSSYNSSISTAPSLALQASSSLCSSSEFEATTTTSTTTTTTTATGRSRFVLRDFLAGKRNLAAIRNVDNKLSSPIISEGGNSSVKRSVDRPSTPYPCKRLSFTKDAGLSNLQVCSK